jgi:hypothetical protein
MSRRNGDRSRFQINRKRKIRRRQRVRAMVTAKRDGDAAQTITPPAKPE